MLSNEAVNTCYSVLRNSSVFASINQKLYKCVKSPLNTGECIVINALPMTDEQLQECVLNVNVFVPNIKTTLPDNSIDESIPNSKRLTELSKMIYETLHDYDTENVSMRIEQEHTLQNDNFKEHYQNIRVKFININF